MTPLQRYQQDIADGLVVLDESQLSALEFLQRLHAELVNEIVSGDKWRFGWLKRLASSDDNREATKGIYF